MLMILLLRPLGHAVGDRVCDEPKHAGEMPLELKLARVEMTPRAFLGMIKARQQLPAFWTRPSCSSHRSTRFSWVFSSTHATCHGVVIPGIVSNSVVSGISDLQAVGRIVIPR